MRVLYCTRFFVLGDYDVELFLKNGGTVVVTGDDIIEVTKIEHGSRVALRDGTEYEVCEVPSRVFALVCEEASRD